MNINKIKFYVKEFGKIVALSSIIVLLHSAFVNGGTFCVSMNMYNEYWIEMVMWVIALYSLVTDLFR